MEGNKQSHSRARDYKHSNSLTVESIYNSAEGTVTSTLREGEPYDNLKSSHVPRGQTTFDDGVRSVDFVLAWDTSYPSCLDPTSMEKRKIFQQKLQDEGLELEYVPVSPGNTLNFVKIHAPFEVLRRYSEILKLRMPMRKVHRLKRQAAGFWGSLNEASSSLFKRFIYVDKSIFPDRRKRFTAIYSRDKEYLLLIVTSVKGRKFGTYHSI